VSRRDSNGADLVQSEHTVPPFVPPFEGQHDGIAFPDPCVLEEVSRTVAQQLHLGERDDPLVPEVVAPDQGDLVRRLPGHYVDYVEGEVEIGRHIQAVILLEIVVRLEFRLV